MIGEVIIERILWSFRYVLLLAVFSLLLGCVVFLFMGAVEMYSIFEKMITVSITEGPTHLHDHYQDILLTGIVGVDDILLGTVLLIFGMGLYDLFISRINPAEDQDDIRPDWLVFSSIDELKSVLGKVILMIMIVTFLKSVVKVDVENGLDVLYLGGGIAAIALALKWSHEGGHGDAQDIARSTMEERLRRLHGEADDEG